MSIFNFLNPKQSLLSSGVLRGATDVHSHLLPGVDDGVQSMEEALQTLQELKAIGIKQIYLTPHVMDHGGEEYKKKHETVFQELVRQCPKEISLRLAGEYMLDSHFMGHLERGLLTYSDRRVLVETSYAAPPLDLEEMLYEINLQGYTPILAHPERYNYMEEKDYARLKRRGCLFQLNLLSTVGYYGRKAHVKSMELLKKESYDFAGSDIHQLGKFQKGAGVSVLKRKEIAALRKLMENNRQLW